MSRPMPPHGTGARRRGSKTRQPCLCTACVTGYRREHKAERIRRERGITGEVPVGAAAAHVRRLVAGGRTILGIAEDAGLEWQTVKDVLASERPSILRTTSEKLLAVTAMPDDTALIDATGTVRRIRALVAMGHSQQSLMEEIGCAFSYVSTLAHGRKPTVTVALAKAVHSTYAKFSMTVGTSVRARMKAERLGWASPLAWDDDTIDDPNAVPQTDAPMPIASEGANIVDRWLLGESVILGAVDRRQAMAHLFEWTELTPAEIADRLEMTESAASRAWERHKEKARKAGDPVPWRRRWAVRNKELTKNEMGAAA